MREFILKRLYDFISGKGVFRSEAEFLEYWQGYKRTQRERMDAYSNIDEFRSRGF